MFHTGGDCVACHPLPFFTFHLVRTNPGYCLAFRHEKIVAFFYSCPLLHSDNFYPSCLVKIFFHRVFVNFHWVVFLKDFLVSLMVNYK